MRRFDRILLLALTSLFWCSVVSANVLRQVEAETRFKQVSRPRYVIHYELSPNAGFKVRQSLDFFLKKRAAKASSKLFMELHQAKISKLRVNGQSRVPNYRENRLWFDVSDLRSGKNNRVEIEFERDYAKDGAGLHRFVDPEDSQVYLYTQGEVYNAQKYFLAFDQPDLKGTFKLSAEAPKEWRVLSNGAEVKRREGKTTTLWSFAETSIISTYLVAIVAGPLLEWRDQYQDIQPIVVEAPQSSHRPCSKAMV